MKILYVTVAVPPATGGSVIITENLVKQFDRDQIVVVGSNHIFSKRGGLDIKNGIRYHYQRTDINFRGRGNRFFVPLRYLFFPFLVWRVCRVYRQEKCDYILANFPDIYYCYAAYLASRILNVRFSTYFHNTYLENRPKGHMNFFAKRWQPKIFAKSENIFVMSDGMKNYYEAKYGNSYRFVSLPHTHSVTTPDAPISLSRPLSAPYRLVFIGNFNQSNIEATVRVVNALKNDARFEMYFYTAVPNFLLKLRGIDVEHVYNKGYISDNLLLDELQNYDVCVLTHGFTGGYTDVEYRTIFPTRTIPFLLSGKPIFAHSPTQSFLNDFLKSNACAFLVEEASENIIKSALLDLVSDDSLRTKLVNNALRTANQFDGKNVVRKLMDNVKMPQGDSHSKGK